MIYRTAKSYVENDLTIFRNARVVYRFWVQVLTRGIVSKTKAASVRMAEKWNIRPKQLPRYTGWWFYPSWKILVNGKDYPIYYGKYQMFQTTNQYMYPDIYIFNSILSTIFRSLTKHFDLT